LCDDKNATVSVLKVKDTKQLIGGYNPSTWSSTSAWLSGERSFLFSMKFGGPQISISRWKSGSTILCNPSNGPVFGGPGGLLDLYIVGNDFKNGDECCSRFSGYYD